MASKTYRCGMRQMEERHIANQIELMIWSNRLDLIALSNTKGEVQVHRLHWQKVWTLTPPCENDLVTVLTWRPDGKALAVGYNSGYVCIVDVENKEILEKFYPEEHVPENEITCISWPVKIGATTHTNKYNLYDDSSIFLQTPPLLNSGYKGQNSEEGTKNQREIPDQVHLHMLIVGYGTGKITMRIFGKFPLGIIDLRKFTSSNINEKKDVKILDIVMSEDFSFMQVLYSDRSNNNISVVILSTKVLNNHAEEILTVANKHSRIALLVSHLDQTMIAINEAWETILLEMDTKMADYAASVPEGGVSADFLELLMMGVTSDELELFLLQELTAKGLKKFGSSVELSYSTIQKLVLKQLNIIAQNLLYCLSELRGLSRIPDQCKIIKLDEKLVTEAIKASFAFRSKCLELQQVIDVSMRNYKTFFRWLFVCIVRLLDEQTPSEIVKITQQDLSHIAEFLYNFDSVKMENVDSNEKPVKFNLERLGQYLQNQFLTILPEEDKENTWRQFLNENPCFLKDNDTIYPLDQFRNYSLVQQQNHLKNELKKVFNLSENDLDDEFSILQNVNLMPISDLSKLKYSQLHDLSANTFYVALMDVSVRTKGLFFLSIDLKKGLYGSQYSFSADVLHTNMKMEPSSDLVDVIDFQFYSPVYLTVLIQHPTNKDNTILLQVPIKFAASVAPKLFDNVDFAIQGSTSRDFSRLLDLGLTLDLEKMKGDQIAVSGGRKVAVVMAKRQRKVRIYEVEVPEDDEDLSISHNSTFKSDGSQTPDKKMSELKMATDD